MEAYLAFGDTDLDLTGGPGGNTTLLAYKDGVQIIDPNWTLTPSPLARGRYKLVIPSVTSGVIEVYIYKTSNPAIYWEGTISNESSVILDVMAPNNVYTAAALVNAPAGEVHALFQTILNRLLSERVEATVAIVDPTPIDDLVLFQGNDYPEFEITLGPQWTLYLDGTYDVYFVVSDNLTTLTSWLEITGTILDQGTCTIKFPITAGEIDVVSGKYMWQVQLRLPNPDPLLPPLSMKVAAYGHLYIKRTFPEPVPVP